MGPYAPDFLKASYGPQMCASSAHEVPWQQTSAQQTAGSVPGIESHMVMDAYGNAKYLDEVFPPMDMSSMFSLRDLYSDWGACRPQWGTSPPCADNLPMSQCPKNSVCLRLEPSSPAGLAFLLRGMLIY